MQLIPAYGGPEMREAHASMYVQEIANFLYNHLDADPDFFTQVALFLRNHTKHVSKYASASFTLKVKELCEQQNHPNPDGSFTNSPHINNFIQLLTGMYGQDQDKLKFQRGAILELLTYMLVSSRCNAADCKLNHRLVDRDPFINSRQIDVAVLSMRDRQIEGYSCKVNPDNPDKSLGLQAEDCTNLMDLEDHGLCKHFSTYLGVVGIERAEVVQQKLKKLEPRPYAFTSIKAYGWNNMRELKKAPSRRF